jgi:hypothetical protein
MDSRIPILTIAYNEFIHGVAASTAPPANQSTSSQFIM